MSAAAKEKLTARVHEFMGRDARREAEARRHLALELGRCQAMTAAMAAMLGTMGRSRCPEAERPEILAGLAELLEGIAATAGAALKRDAE